MDQNWFEKIGDYVSGHLAPGEKLQFEAALEEDPALRDDLNMYRLIEAEMKADLINKNQEAELKDSLRKLNAIYFPNKQTRNINDPESREQLSGKNILPPGIAAVGNKKNKNYKTWSWLGIAACMAGLVGISITIFYINKNESAEIVAANKVNAGELFATYFNTDSLPEDREGVLSEAFDFYEQRQYSEAIHAIENADYHLVTRGPAEDTAVTNLYAGFYKAQSYMAMGNMAKAIPELLTIIQLYPDSLYQAKASWYLALAYLKSGNLKESIEMLNRLGGNKESMKYSIKARSLLNRLKGAD